jgi:low affinity Fe/Cu permease
VIVDVELSEVAQFWVFTVAVFVVIVIGSLLPWTFKLYFAMTIVACRLAILAYVEGTEEC